MAQYTCYYYTYYAVVYKQIAFFDQYQFVRKTCLVKSLIFAQKFRFSKKFRLLFDKKINCMAAYCMDRVF